MASSTFSDLPAPAGERGPLNNTLIIIVNNDGTLTVDQETLHKLLAEQENTSTNAVRLIRLGVSPSDCRSPSSSDGEDSGGGGGKHVNITVEGYYPPGHGYPLAADEPLEPVIADEMSRLGQVNAMLDILSADDSFTINDSIKMDHCYTNRLPCSDPNYLAPRAKAPEGRSFFAPAKKGVATRSPLPVAAKVAVMQQVKRTPTKVPASGSLLKKTIERAQPPPPPPVSITEEMLNEKMMQFQRSSDDYNNLSGDENEDKSNSSAEQSVDVEDFAPATGVAAAASDSFGGKTAPRTPAVYKVTKVYKKTDAEVLFGGDSLRTPKMQAHKLVNTGLKVYGKAKGAAEASKETPPPEYRGSGDDSKKNYPRRENRKPPAHLLESFAGPALFSVPDVPRRVSLEAKAAALKSLDADFDFVGDSSSGLGATDALFDDARATIDGAGQSRLTSALLNQLDATAARGEKAQRQSVDTVSTDSLGEMEMVTEDDPNKLWCICQKPHNNRFMICCDVCGEWFHGKCVGITKAIGQTMEEHGNEWTCPNCKKKNPKGNPPGSGKKQTKITTFMRKPKPVEAPSADVPAVVVATCVICKKAPREGTVYCSDDCLQKHAHDTAMIDVNLAPAPVPQLETAPASVPATAPGLPDVGPTEKPPLKKPAPVTCGVKTSRPGSLKTWLKPSPALAKTLPPPLATSSPIKQKQAVLIDAKPLAPAPSNKPGKTPTAAAEAHKDGAAAEKVGAAPNVPKPAQSPAKAAAAKHDAKHDVKRASKVETKAPDAAKKEDKETQLIRLNVRKTLHEQLLARTTECEDLKSIADEKVKRIAAHIEEELFAYFNKDAGSKYKSKYRSLIFNIKDPKNLTLFRKIVDKSISAHQLVRLSAEEFASQELTQWREQETKHQLEMIKKNELDLLALSKTYVMKTHKGEQVIETDGFKGDASKITDMDIDSVTSGDAEIKSKVKKEKAKSKSNKRSKSHKSSRDKKKHHSKSKHHKTSHESSSSSTQKKLDDYVHVVDRREDLNVSKDSDFDNGYTGKDLDDLKPAPVMDASSVQEIIFGKASEDQEMDVDASSNESLGTPEHYAVDKEAASTVWRGVAEMPDVARFLTTIQVVSGDSESHCQTLPDRLSIVGRISPDTVWDHISKMKKTDSHEIMVVRLTAKNENEKIAYVTLYSYLNTRNRLGVVGKKGVVGPVSQSIKDFYILPLSNHSPVPQVLLPLHGPGLEEDRPHLLLGILVARSGRKRAAAAPAAPAHGAKVARQSDSVDARTFTPPPPPDDDDDMQSPPRPPSSDRDSRPSTPRSTPDAEREKNFAAEAETIRAKVSSLLDVDEDAPYSPKDEDEEVPVARLTEAEESSLALQRKMEELNRKIAEQKLEIENISSSFVGDSLIPGLGAIPSFMDGKFAEMEEAEEAYSPSESLTPPPKETIPFISGAGAPPDVMSQDISLPSNLHEILANIKKNTTTETKMDLKRDPIVQSYSARMDEVKEKIAAKKEQFSVGSAVYIPSSIKKSTEPGGSKVEEPHEVRPKDSAASGKVAASSSIAAKPPIKPPSTMQAASGDPRKRPTASIVDKSAGESSKPTSTLSKLTDAELIEKAAAMEFEMSVPLAAQSLKKTPIKFSIPSQFGRAQGIGILSDILPPPPPPPPPEMPPVQSMRRVPEYLGLNSQASMPCNPPPPISDYHIPFTNPPPPLMAINPAPPLPGMNPPPPLPSRPPMPGRIPLPPLPATNPLPPVPGMNPLPPLPGTNPLPPLPGMNPPPPLPGMNPPAPGSQSLYSHHPPPYRRERKFDRNH